MLHPRAEWENMDNLHCKDYRRHLVSLVPLLPRVDQVYFAVLEDDLGARVTPLVVSTAFPIIAISALSTYRT